MAQQTAREPNLRAVILTLAVTAIVTTFAACGTSANDTAGNQVETPVAVTTGDEEEVVATDTSETETKEAYSEPDTQDAALEPISIDVSDTTFSEHIQPIMETSCASCHRPELAGSDHFVIDTAQGIADYAKDIEIYVRSKEMPPWPASDLSIDFHDNPTLSDEQIARVSQWVADGAELDVDPSTEILPSTPQSNLEGDERDIVMTSIDGPYAGSGELVDEYRCLIYEPGNEKLEYIIGTHFEPDETQVVHHAIVTMASGALREQADEMDAADPGPGWSCYGGAGFVGGVEGGYTARLGGWAPGGQPNRLPEGYAIPLTVGDFVVVQIHYHYDGSTPPDLSRYVLSLASQEQIDANAGWFKRLTGALYLGPAEIPCYADDTNPLCDRNKALERVRDLYGPRVGAFSNFFLNQCGAKPEDFVDMTEGTAWSTCDLPVKNPGVIHSVTGHMHELGLSVRLTLNPDTPEEKILLDIPDWNFEWQFGYQPTEEIIIDADDIIRVDCAWNRERAPYEADGYILWADGTGDEMCYTGITTRPLE